MNAPEVDGLDRRVAGIVDALPEAVGLTRGKEKRGREEALLGGGEDGETLRG